LIIAVHHLLGSGQQVIVEWLQLRVIS
jgi:hypothetical protein